MLTPRHHQSTNTTTKQAKAWSVSTRWSSAAQIDNRGRCSIWSRPSCSRTQQLNSLWHVFQFMIATGLVDTLVWHHNCISTIENRACKAYMDLRQWLACPTDRGYARTARGAFWLWVSCGAIWLCVCRCVWGFGRAVIPEVGMIGRAMSMSCQHKFSLTIIDHQ